MFRKNTAGQFIHFQGVDATTGGIKSGVTWTVRRCIDGTFAAATGTATEDSTNGWYKFALSQADTNGNDIGFNFTGTGASVNQTSPTLVTPVLGVATGTSLALSAGVTQGVTTISGDGAVTIASGHVILTKGSAAAITVAAPSSQDGTRITITSNSDFAHVVTFTGSTLLDGTTGANLTVTMTAFKGSSIEILAVGTKWLLLSSSNVTSITA